MKLSARSTVSPANTSREALVVVLGARLERTADRVPSAALSVSWSPGIGLTHVLVSCTVARLRPLRNVQVTLTGVDVMVTLPLVPFAVVPSEHTRPETYVPTLVFPDGGRSSSTVT